MLEKVVLTRPASQVLFFFILSLLTCEVLLGNIHKVSIPKLEIGDCLLPENHQLQNKLKYLFDNPDMFESSQHLQLAGFDVLSKIHRGLLVASHPTIENYLIKKFQNNIPQNDQIDNYVRRIIGARALYDFIKVNKLKHIVVPRKWLYQLPKQFSNSVTKQRSYILIVEKMNICSGGKSLDGELAKRYYDMDLDILRELCIVVYYFRGLDSVIENMPFTYQNTIAFIDTEHWEHSGRKGFLSRIMHFLAPDRQKYVSEVLREFQEQDQRYANTRHL